METTYNLRRNPLPVPAVKFLFVAKKLDEKSHSLAGFSNYVAKTMFDRYEYLCTNDPCLPDGRL